MTIATDSAVLVYDDLSESLAAALTDAGRVAWDIETSGLDSRSCKIATCQLYAEGVGALVVQLNGSQPTRLPGLLADPAVIKVFHHAPFDLRFMVGHWHVLPASVKCTKVASKLLAPQLSKDEHSLASLVRRVLGVELDKHERLSDWLAEELSPGQVAYAANDVRFLLPLIDALESEAVEAGLGALLQRCFDYLPTRAELDVRGYEDIYAY